jgi:hypothetical protein
MYFSSCKNIYSLSFFLLIVERKKMTDFDSGVLKKYIDVKEKNYLQYVDKNRA